MEKRSCLDTGESWTAESVKTFTRMQSFAKPESKTRIVASAIVRAAASEACGFAFEKPNAWEFARAAAASVQEETRLHSNGEGQRMAARFTCDAEIYAGLTPLGAVWLNTSSSCAKLRQQVG